MSQIELIKSIINAVTKQAGTKNIAMPPRRFNTVIDAANLIIATFAQAVTPSNAGMGLQAWLFSDDVGASSKYLANTAMSPGFPFIPPMEMPWPHDADDFGRCVRLFAAAPETRAAIAKIAATKDKDVPHQWKKIAAIWDELEAMYKAENYKGLYERIKIIEMGKE